MLTLLKKIAPKTIYGYFALSFVCLISIVNLIWINQNKVPPTYDPSWYLEVSENLYHDLTDFGLGRSIDTFSESFKMKAPLISVFPIPFYLIFGNTEKNAYLSLIVCGFILNYFLFKLTKLIKDEKAAFYAICIFNTFPLIIGMSRLFFVEYFLITVLIAWIYFLLKSNLLTEKKYTTYLGITLGIGLLLKILFPFLIFAPTAYVIYKSYIKNKKTGFNIKKPVLKIIFLGALIASVWYIKNIIYILYFLYTASFGPAAKNYSPGAVFSLSTFYNYWTAIINYGISFYYFLITLISAVIYFFIKKNDKIKKEYLLCFLLWFSVPFFVFNFGVNKDIRFVSTILPAISILLSLMFCQILKNLKYQLVLFIIIIIFPIFQLMLVSFKNLPAYKYNYKNFVLVSDKLRYAYRPSDKKWPLEEIADYIYKDSIWSSQKILIAIAPSIPEFNHNNFRYYSSLKNYDLLDFSGLPRDSEQKYFQRINSADYIIVYEQKNKELDWLNKYNDQLLENLNNKQLPFLELKDFILPNNKKLLLFKKT